jgi:hypothetical protein
MPHPPIGAIPRQNRTGTHAARDTAARDDDRARRQSRGNDRL